MRSIFPPKFLKIRDSLFGRCRAESLGWLCMCLALGVGLPTGARGATWDGGGADNLYNTPENWTTDTAPTLAETAYVFQGSTRLTPVIGSNSGAASTSTNSTWVASSIEFAAGAGSFDLQPLSASTTTNRFEMTNNSTISQNSENDQTISATIYLGTSGNRVIVQGSGTGELTLSNLRLGSNVELELNHNTTIGATSRTGSTTGQIFRVGEGATVKLTQQLIPQISMQVNNGTLLINHATDTGSVGIAVAAQGVLGGTGTIRPGSGKGILVSASGTVNPGENGIGTLTMDGGSTTEKVLVMESNARFVFDLNSTGEVRQSDTLSLTNGATGDISFSANTVNFNNLAGGALALGSYTLFSATNSNQYEGLVTDGEGFITGGLTVGTGLEGFTSNLQLVGSNIVLNVTAVPEPRTWALVAGAFVWLAWGCRRMRRMV